MVKKENTLSLVINTKNEEKNIRDCILSAKDIVDEIIVVDMQSTDKTVEFAKELGAKVYPVKDFGYVEPARNFALNKATKKWTLVLDGDERLTPMLKKIIVKLIDEEGTKYDGFNFPFKNILLGKWIQHSMWWPDYQLRVFKTGHMDWPLEVHKKQIFKGEILNLEPLEENAFVHYNIADIKELLEMVDQYSTKEAYFEEHKNFTAEELVAYLGKEFRWRYLEHEGYLDGMHGFILGKFMDVYRLLEFAKYWEKHGLKDYFKPEELKSAVENYSGLQMEINRLQGELDKIRSSKPYRLWRIYGKVKKIVHSKKNHL